MKRTFIMGLAFILLAGCGGQATETPPPTETPTLPTPTQEVLAVESEAADWTPDIEVSLEPQTVVPGEGAVLLDLAFPEGWHINLDAKPFNAVWMVDGEAVQIDEAERRMVFEQPSFPLGAPAVLSEGEAEVQAQMTVYYCNDDQTLCTRDRIRLVVPVTVNQIATSNEIVLAYEVEPPAVE